MVWEFISEVIMDDIILFAHILGNLIRYLVYTMKGVYNNRDNIKLKNIIFTCHY